MGRSIQTQAIDNNMGKYIFQDGGTDVTASSGDFLNSIVDQFLQQQQQQGSANSINNVDPNPPTEPQYTDAGEGSRFMEMAQDTEKDMTDKDVLEKAVSEELDRREQEIKSKMNGGDYGYSDEQIAALYDSAVSTINSADENNPLGIGPSRAGVVPQPTSGAVSYNYNTFATLGNRLNNMGSNKSTETPNQNSIMAYNYYKSKGIAPHAAAAIVGNLYRESGLNTKATEKTNTGNGRGIAQWDVRDRWPALLKWASNSGRDPYSLTTQLDYVLEEPGEGQAALNKALNSSNVDDATVNWGRKFERPNDKYAAWHVRKSIANQLFNSDNEQNL